MPCSEGTGSDMSQRLVTNQGQVKRLSVLDDSWMDDAACNGKDTNDFYDFESGNPMKEQDAKTFCVLACPVRERCLMWALLVPEPYGVWGGMGENERRELRRTKEVRRAMLDVAV